MLEVSRCRAHAPRGLAFAAAGMRYWVQPGLAHKIAFPFSSVMVLTSATNPPAFEGEIMMLIAVPGFKASSARFRPQPTRTSELGLDAISPDQCWTLPLSSFESQKSCG